MKYIKKIFKQLNLNEQNGLIMRGDNNNSYLNKFSSRIERLLSNTIEPCAVFCMDKKPFILFFENLSNEQKKEKFKQIWNFNDVPVVIMVNQDSVEIYNGFKYLTADASLSKLDNNKIDDFNYFKMVTGETWEKYKKEFGQKDRLDNKLLENIKYARDKIIAELNRNQDKVEIANSLLGKIIFIRYLIDRRVKLSFNGNISKEWRNQDLCELLVDKTQIKLFFNYLEVKFNGDLFPINEHTIDEIPETCFDTLINLLSGDELKTGQQSLFDIYDFSIIPVEFISNIYESFIGQDEQAKTGAFYTPLFLVDYILAETVEKKFNYDNKVYNCKVLDPSCGSGIFLVESLRKIIEQYNINNPDQQKDTKQYTEQLKELVRNNIFGVDKDKRAIDVAIFSIYLTLLDYQEASDIETFKFPNLLDSNFFIADFFDTTDKFNNIFNDFEFDFILGNPPWGNLRKSGGNQKYIDYIDKRRIHESKYGTNLPYISNNEIVQAFIFRVGDFCASKTKCGLIVKSKIFTNIDANLFREYLLNTYTINKILELSSVRHEVFNKKAVAPASLLFYQLNNVETVNKNIIEYITLKPSRIFSIFKIFVIYRNDYKKILQNKLKDFDCLWKILIYGNYLDFNFIQRLKLDYDSILDIISDKNKYAYGIGVLIGSEKKCSAEHLLNKVFIDAKNDIEAFWINKHLSTWQELLVSRPRNKLLYESPMLLIPGGMTNELRMNSAVCHHDAVFQDSITAVKSIKNETQKLEIMCGIINSSLTSYLALQTFSSPGIERPDALANDKYSIPFIDNELILGVVRSITSTSNEDLLGLNTSHVDHNMLQKLDKVVIEAFSLSEQEKSLLDYTINVTIPNINKCYDAISKPQELGSKVIQDYINIFFNRFDPIHKKQNLQLKARVSHNDTLICIYFDLVSINTSDKIKWESIPNAEFFRLPQLLSVEKITDRLFVQKDIRGFEENGFYIIKPNEMKLWHQAIAYLDVDEFMDAILRAGREVDSNVQK